jgi:hypothetical protein
MITNACVHKRSVVGFVAPLMISWCHHPVPAESLRGAKLQMEYFEDHSGWGVDLRSSSLSRISARSCPHYFRPIVELKIFWPKLQQRQVSGVGSDSVPPPPFRPSPARGSNTDSTQTFSSNILSTIKRARSARRDTR